MKRLINIIIISLFLIWNLSSVASGIDSTSENYIALNIEQSKSSFYDNLYQIVSSQDSSHYFRKLEMNIGSNKYFLDGEERNIKPVESAADDPIILGLQIISEVNGATFQYEYNTRKVFIHGRYGCNIQYLAETGLLSINGSFVNVKKIENRKESVDYLIIETVVKSLDMDITQDVTSGQITVTSPYQTCRIIVWGNKPDLSGLKFNKVITDGSGLWVLQFYSPSESKSAQKQLEKKGVIADPDQFIPFTKYSSSDNEINIGDSDLMSVNSSFYSDLYSMINSQDDSYYFGKVEMTIGSSQYLIDGIESKINPLSGVQTDNAVIGFQILSEVSGSKLKYDSQLSSVSIIGRNNSDIQYSIGSSAISIGGSMVSVGAPGDDEDEIDYQLISTMANALDMEAVKDESSEIITVTAPYQTCRLIAWADTIDTTSLNPIKVINDGTGLWVLQFDTPISAMFAQEQLMKEGIVVDPDAYIPSGGSNPISGKGSEVLSWGVNDCHFPDFIKKNSDKMNGTCIVAVIDSGVDDKHPFLSGKVISGHDFIENDDNPFDENGHGTHVSGTIIDCVGNNSVKILPVRILNERGRGNTINCIAGIKYAIQNGADIINLSLGGAHGDVMDKSIEFAVQNGTVVVIAAGNEAQNTEDVCPAHLTMPGTIIVSAGDENHSHAFFSNYGNSIDIMAPGVDIRSCYLNNDYVIMDGTSQAVPHVSAAVALIDLVYGKKLSPAEIEDKIHEATTYGKWRDEVSGYGFLDMSKVDTGKRVNLPFGDKGKINHQEAVSALVSMNVIQGYPDQTFRPKNTLTRAEACTILTRLMGLKSTAGKNIDFSDVQGHWAESYIRICSERGIVIGYGNGKFGPDDKLTGVAWEKMLLAAMGYNPEATGMIGATWQIGVSEMVKATKLDRDIYNFNASAPINRDDTCQIAYNSIS